MKIRKTKNIAFIVSLILVFWAKLGLAQYGEYEVKAAYIFNFAKFVDLPQGSVNNDTIILGIYKPDPFGIILEKTMVGRKVRGKNWKIVRTSSIKELKKCNIVFISDAERYQVLKILENLKTKKIITVGDEIIDFCELGGIINFSPQFSERQFEINNDAAKSKGIIFSPKLLLLAKIISNDEAEV